MLNQKRSGSLARLKYLLAVPMCGAMLCASTLSFSKDYGLVDLLPQKHSEKKALALHVPAGTKNMKLANDDEINPDSPKMYKAILLGSDTPQMVKGWIVGEDTNKTQKTPTKITLTSPTKDKEAEVVNGQVFELKLDEPVTSDNGQKTSDKSKEPTWSIGVAQNTKPISQEKTPVQVADFPINTPFAGLFEYLTKNVRYPAQARNKKTVGAVDMDVTIEKDGSIGDKNKAGGISDGCDVEVLRALNKYKDKISAKPGTYRIAVIFQLALDDRKVLSGPLPIPVVTPITSAGIVNIVGYGEKL